MSPNEWKRRRDERLDQFFSAFTDEELTELQADTAAHTIFDSEEHKSLFLSCSPKTNVYVRQLIYERMTAGAGQPGPPSRVLVMTIDQALRFLSGFGLLVTSLDTANAAYKRAAVHFHPDRNGGRTLDGWQKTQDAIGLVRVHFGGAS